MYVSIRTPEGEIGQVTLEGGKAVPHGAAVSVLDGFVVVEAGSLSRLSPDAGERFLQALPRALSGTYLWATLVQ